MGTSRPTAITPAYFAPRRPAPLRPPPPRSLAPTSHAPSPRAPQAAPSPRSTLVSRCSRPRCPHRAAAPHRPQWLTAAVRGFAPRPPRRSSRRAPRSCPVACPTLVSRCGRARCPHRAAAPSARCAALSPCPSPPPLREFPSHPLITRAVRGLACPVVRSRCARAPRRAASPAVAHRRSARLRTARAPTARGGSRPTGSATAKLHV